MIKKQLVRYMFIDIVGFTRPERTVAQQLYILNRLNEIIMKSVKDVPFNKRIMLPTGVGVCLAFMEWEDQAYDFDLRLSSLILKEIHDHNASMSDENARFGIRIGLNEEEDDIVVDVNGHVNFSGRGVNYARRIMDLADANQVLIGAGVYNRLSKNPDFRFKKYNCAIKHEQSLVVYQCIRMSREADDAWLNTADIQFHDAVKKPVYEKEYKFLIPGGADDAFLTLASIKSQINRFVSAFTVHEKDIEESRNTYFDDGNRTLHSAGASLAIRREKGLKRIAVRKRFFTQELYRHEDAYRRIEEETPLSDAEEEALSTGKPVNALPYRILPYIAPDCGPLIPWFDVANKKKVLHLKNRHNHSIDICLNELTYFGGAGTYGPYYELEIENKGAPADVMESLAVRLEENMGLLPSRQSRYERGVSLLKTAQAPKEKKMVIIDTDCGVDDAYALILALRAPELDVKAVTTVSGQVHADKVTANVFKTLRALGVDPFPLVGCGADRPLKRKLATAEFIHGEDGLGDVIPDPPEQPCAPEPAWKLICSLARRHPKQITLITIGPMTNAALAIQHDPEGFRRLKEVVAMAGVFFEYGNVGPGAEFNVHTDPDAVQAAVRFCTEACRKTPVDADGNPVALPDRPTRRDYERIAAYQDRPADDPERVPLTFVGLDVAHKVMFRRSILDRLVRTHPDNGVLKFIQQISGKYLDYCFENEWLPGVYLYDPLAVGYVINPSFLEIEKHIIHVETSGGPTAGMIVPDMRPTRNPAWRNPAEAVIGVARRVEKEAFEEFFIMRMLGAD